MTIFHLPQFEHEPFWQYLSRLNDFRAQYVLFDYEKWEICDVVLEGITHETRATLESMCHGGMCYLDVDDMWDLFESLAWYQWHHEQAIESFECPSPTPYDFHVYSPPVCSYCHSLDHDVNSCPYSDISDECYAELNAMIGTMNERLECFEGKMRETDLLHETAPSPSSLRLEVSLYDDYESSLPFEPDFMADSPLAGLGEVTDPSLTSLPFVTPSLLSAPSETTEGVLSLLSTPLPLAQCTGLEMGESPRGGASFVEDDLLDWLGDIALLEPSYQDLYSDDVRVSAAPSIEHIDPICTKPLDLTPISSPFLSTTPSPLHAFHESLGDIRGYNPSLDPYCAYLDDMPRKIEWTTFFDNDFDFSMAFDEFKRALTLFAPSLLVFSYSHYFEMHAKAHDKLLRALTASELTTRILRGKEWLMLLKPL